MDWNKYGQKLYDELRRVQNETFGCAVCKYREVYDCSGCIGCGTMRLLGEIKKEMDGEK